MSETVLTTLLDHNAWATRVLWRECLRRTPEERTREFEIGLGSLQATMLHVAGAMARWADRIGDRPPRATPEHPARTWEAAALTALLDEADRDLRDVAHRVVETGRLDERMEFALPPPDAPVVFTRRAALVHVLTHGAHHRAQALNMLRRLGATDLPDLDAITCELSLGERA